MNGQTLVMFFDTLDLSKDGLLSRSDLNTSAKRLKWSWHEAPLLAALDLLSISKPIPKSKFIDLINQINNDPLGPYGNILLKSAHFLQPASLRGHRILNDETAEEDNGISVVESAVVQMLDEGVKVVRQIEWH